MLSEETPIDEKVFIISVQNRKKKDRFPGIAIVPSSYNNFSNNNNNDYELLKRILEIIGKRWSIYEEFFGIVTNFKETIFMRYDRSKKIYGWHYIVNFKECFYKESPRKKCKIG